MLVILKKVRTCNKVIFFSPHFNLHFNNNKSNKRQKHKNTGLQSILSGTREPQYKDLWVEEGCLAPSRLSRETLGGWQPSKGACLGHRPPPQGIAKRDLPELTESTKAKSLHITSPCFTGPLKTFVSWEAQTHSIAGSMCSQCVHHPFLPSRQSNSATATEKQFALTWRWRLLPDMEGRPGERSAMEKKLSMVITRNAGHSETVLL